MISQTRVSSITDVARITETCDGGILRPSTRAIGAAGRTGVPTASGFGFNSHMMINRIGPRMMPRTRNKRSS